MESTVNPDALFQTMQITFFSNGINYPVAAFKDRLQFIGDLNKKDASIQLLNAKFSDNGTYFCDVKNPPDVAGTPGRTELRVVPRGEPESTCFFLLCVFQFVGVHEMVSCNTSAF